MTFSSVSPELPDRALAGGARLRPATGADCESLTALSLAAKAVWGYSADFLQITRDDMTVTPERLAEEAVLLIERAGVPLALVAVASEESAPDAAEITMAFVATDAQGQGFGALLLREAIALCRAAGTRRLIVVSDPNAEGFYRRMGFAPEGLHRSEYIPDRTLPRLAMEL
ncbi:MAG: hypothetical protein Kilf2KO_03570 [Rhodospirillales bacterium]